MGARAGSRARRHRPPRPARPAGHVHLLKLLDPHPLVVLGELDEIARPADFEGVVLEEHVRIVRESGHLPDLERPDRFDPILEEALERWRR